MAMVFPQVNELNWKAQRKTTAADKSELGRKWLPCLDGRRRDGRQHLGENGRRRRAVTGRDCGIVPTLQGQRQLQVREERSFVFLLVFVLNKICPTINSLLLIHFKEYQRYEITNLFEFFFQYQPHQSLFHLCWGQQLKLYGVLLQFHSLPCRTEAEYAYKCNKDVVPLLLEKNYKADGWLGKRHAVVRLFVRIAKFLLFGQKIWNYYKNLANPSAA